MSHKIWPHNGTLAQWIADQFEPGYIGYGIDVGASDGVSINTTFNAQTTNVLTIGLNGTTANNIVATVTASALALVPNLLPTGTALGKLTADTQVYVKYTQTGTAATAGAATFIIKYAAVVS